MSLIVALCLVCLSATAADRPVLAAEPAAGKALPQPPRPRPLFVPALPVAIPPFAVGPFRGRAHTSPQGRRLLHCLAEGSLSGGVTLAVRLTRFNDIAIAFTHDGWALPTGLSFPWSGGGGKELPALVVARNRIAVPFGNDISLVARILGQGWVEVPYPGGGFEVLVPQGRPLISALSACVAAGIAQEADQHGSLLATVDSGAGCHPPQPGGVTMPGPGWLSRHVGVTPAPGARGGSPAGDRDTPPLAAEGELGGFVDRAATRMALDLAGLARAELLPVNVIAADFPGALHGWRIGSVTGFVSLWQGQALSAGASTSVAARFAPEAARCPGRFEAESAAESGVPALPAGTPQAGGIGVNVAAAARASIERFTLRCYAPGAARLTRIAVARIAGHRIAVSHCGDLADTREIEAADRSMVTLLDLAAGGWPELQAR